MKRFKINFHSTTKNKIMFAKRNIKSDEKQKYNVPENKQ